MNFSIFSRLPSLLARPAHTHVLPFINFQEWWSDEVQEWWSTKCISAAKFRIRWFFCNLFFKVFENLFDWLFTQIYWLYWYVWYSFDYYYFVLTTFTSCLFTYFKIELQYKTFVFFSFFIRYWYYGYLEIPTLPPPSPFILTPLLLLNLRKISDPPVNFDPYTPAPAPASVYLVTKSS